MTAPEKKHRMPSAYNRFMSPYHVPSKLGLQSNPSLLSLQVVLLKFTLGNCITHSPCHRREEIRRIKAAKPDIPHREAFSKASKNVSYRTDDVQVHQISVVVLILLLLHKSKWARCDPRRSTSVSISGTKGKLASVPRVVNPIYHPEKERISLYALTIRK
ncbi:hypothetical protein BHE74_00019881 [Ensete ventricosum]|nr:hypothetical protein BHE74_00019881 [Ensete ventricosum]